MLHEGACVFHEPSANTQAQDGAFAEGGAEGPRCTIFAACRVRETSCDILSQDRVSHEVVGEGPHRLASDVETAEQSKNFLQHAGPMNPQQTLLHVKERLLRVAVKVL